jgi:hypothetical protein
MVRKSENMDTLNTEFQVKNVPKKTDKPAKASKRAPLTEAEKAAKLKEKQKKFVELSTYRLKKCLKDIQQLSYLSNRNAYAFSDTQIEYIMSKLNGAVMDVDSAFRVRAPVKDDVVIPQ